ncbi:MAG: CsiV family protein [Gammaproteobacteria bacterium]
MRTLNNLLLILTLLLFSQVAISKDYIVEMIFFANTNAGSNSVHISNQTINPDLGGSISLNQGSQSNGFVPLTSDTFSLSGKANALTKSGQYKVLKHMAWLQPGLAREDAIAVRVSAGKNYKNEFSERSFANQPANELDGTVKVVLGRFLHVYTDLAYRKAINISSSDALGRNRVLADFPIKTHRKMRSSTLHYIDHPYLGILVEIRPAN